MTTVQDVNEAFAAERREMLSNTFQARVADGRLTSLGNDQYKVNEPGSWDDGEVWTQRGGEILPQHGLDESLGSPALYTTVPAWHSLGNVVPEGVTDIDTVLKLGGIDYDVVKRPVHYPVLFTDDFRMQIMADQFVTVRTDTEDGLGVVGKTYTPIQNRDVFAFLEDLTGSYGLTWESAGALRGGRKVFVCLRLPETVTIDAGGVNDQIVPFIVSTNSHDGSSQAYTVVTPWRPVCGNTERFSMRDASARWGVRHTRNAMQRVDEARRTLGLSVKYFDEFAREEQALAEAELNLTGFGQLLDELWTPPDDDATAVAKTKHGMRRDKLMAGWDTNTARLGRTAYAAERTITEFSDWGRSGLRGTGLAARATAIMEGSDDPLKSKAHKRLLTLTNR